MGIQPNVVTYILYTLKNMHLPVAACLVVSFCESGTCKSVSHADFGDLWTLTGLPSKNPRGMTVKHFGDPPARTSTTLYR